MKENRKLKWQKPVLENFEEYNVLNAALNCNNPGSTVNHNCNASGGAASQNCTNTGVGARNAVVTP